jgi:aminoglycoside phosphotransferase family enzyme/predicted kinase
VSSEQQPVIAALSKPAIYGLPDNAKVERSETHGAVVFLAGDRAYKLKRAVKYLYLDYSTPELRRKACLAELEVNRRVAPDLYLSVNAVVRDGDRLRLADGEPPGTVDWVLVMRRFAESDLLEQQRIAGRFTPELMRTLAETIAGFHANAEKRPDFGGAQGMAVIVDENMTVLEDMAGRVFDRAKVDALARLSWAELERLTPLLDRRRDAGLVRRCHGDLHLNNICLIDGRPTLFDAIEFSEEFASIDVFYDFAFLIMDLDRHGLRGLANTLLNRYLEHTLDYDGLAALPLFLSCRAAIRAHVTVTRAEAMHSSAPADFAEARMLVDRAIAYLEPPPARALAIGGPSGTGKTTVARAVAPALGPCPGAVIVRSDVTRKRLAGVNETTRLPPSGYTLEMNDKVFAALAETAAKVLGARHGVILDAVYGDGRYRAALEEVARQAGVRFDGIWLTAPAEVLEERIGGRRGDASDATVEVLRAQLQGLQKPPTWTAVDASGSVERSADEIKRRLGVS